MTISEMFCTNKHRKSRANSPKNYYFPLIMLDFSKKRKTLFSFLLKNI